MATSYPLFYNLIVTDNVGDRPYDADSFSLWLAKFFTTGVFAGEFAVTEVSGMTVTVSGGFVNIGGKVMVFDETTLELDQAGANTNRYDNIVIERNDTDRQFYLKVVKGVADSTAPAPVRTGGVYQLVIARVHIRAGATAISRSDVQDTRADKTLCGIVAGTVEEMDFEAFTAQFEAYFDEFKTGNQADFEAWFETIQGILDEDVAGNLQNEIDNDVVKRADPRITVDPDVDPSSTLNPDGALFDIAYRKFDWRDAFYADGNICYLKFLLKYMVQKLYEHEEVKTVCVAKNNLTVPGKTSSGVGTLEIDFASDYDTEKYYLWNVEGTLNNFKLPYMTANGNFTNISNVGGTKAIISNNASAWVNYTGYFTLTLKRRS